jgi:hypothetical protein
VDTREEGPRSTPREPTSSAAAAAGVERAQAGRAIAITPAKARGKNTFVGMVILFLAGQPWGPAQAVKGFREGGRDGPTPTHHRSYEILAPSLAATGLLYPMVRGGPGSGAIERLDSDTAASQ